MSREIPDIVRPRLFNICRPHFSKSDSIYVVFGCVWARLAGSRRFLDQRIDRSVRVSAPREPGTRLDTAHHSSGGPSLRSSRKVAFASLIGTTIEWYDFFIFGTAAALIFNQVFFPSFDPVTGTLAAFASFSVGFIARPLGGAVFAHSVVVFML